jgi:hypothetical protein
MQEALDQAGVSTITLPDPASTRMSANNVAQRLLGRDLNPTERQAFADFIAGRVQANQEERRNQVIQAFTDSMAGTYDSDRVGAVGSSLAGQYGLVVTSHQRTPEHNAAVGGVRNSDHLTGMGIDLAGAATNMEALYRWAKANEGPGKLFRVVIYRYEDPQGHSDHVHLSFNTEVDVADGNQPIAVTPNESGLDQFMAAIRQVESGGNYRAVGPATKYGRATGAYQFLDSTWNNYGGFRHASDAPQWMQDQRAAEMMMSYYRVYGDWQLVAAAWNGGPGVANRAKNDRDYLNRVGWRDDKGKLHSVAGYVASVMQGMGGQSSIPRSGIGDAFHRQEVQRGGSNSLFGRIVRNATLAKGRSTFEHVDNPFASAVDPTSTDPASGLRPAITVQSVDPEAIIAETMMNSPEYDEQQLRSQIDVFNQLLAGPPGLPRG